MRRLASLILLALVALPTMARRGEAPEPPPLMTAEALWADPGAKLGADVRLVVQHASWIEAWNPMITRFGDGDYKAWSCWADEQLLWEPAEFDNPSVRLFVRRGGAAEWALAALEPYRRFEVVGRVKAVLGGVPWIEVVGVRPLSQQINDGSLVHAARGLAAYERLDWERAEDEYARALAGPLPPIAHDELRRMQNVARDRRDNPTLEELVERKLKRRD